MPKAGIKTGETVATVGATQLAGLSVDGLFRKYHRILMRFLKERLVNTDEAEDIAQETYYRLARKTDAELLQHPKAFLLKTASNLLIDQNRYRQSRQADAHLDIDDVDVESPSGTPDQQLQDGEQLALLDAALAALTPKCREVFILHRLDGLPYKVIAEDLGISTSMVSKYLGQAMEHIRQQFSTDTRARETSGRGEQ